MDTFMDKLAQKLNAQEMIKANSAADAEEMDQLKNQLREYDECLAQMQQVNKELRAVNHAMETLMSETIAPEVTKLSEESVAAIRKMQQENTEKLQELLAGVVAEGTGRQAAPSEGTAAGKTGTAQTGQFRDGEELKNYWFAGFYPARNPRYTIVVLQDGQTGPSRTSAAIFAQVCDALDAAGE